ncbi:hypothetical protein BY458DRAFT_478682 [Sporodiniella umbellata]|nr:hypothetical protein BY458DRAFT_478682 [Sporodiniella umbellata]
MSTTSSKSTKSSKRSSQSGQLDNKAAKQKATEDKYRLFGTMQAIRQGKMPHNTQLNEMLQKLSDNQIIQSKEHMISDDGRRLLHDFRQLISTLQKTLNTKNKDELFQSMVYHLHSMESPISKDNLNAAAKNNHDPKALKSEGKQASESLLKISKLVLINNEFRALLGDLLDISQDIFSSVTTKLGDSLKNSGDSLQNTGETNRDGKQIVDSVLDRGLERMSPQAHPQDNHLHHHHHHHHQQQQQQQHQAHPQANPLHPSQDNSHWASTDPRHAGLLNTGDSVHPSTFQEDKSWMDQDPQVLKNTAKNALENTPEGQKAQEKQSEFKQRMQHHYRDHKEHVRHTLNDRVPKEKQDELIRRLQRVLTEIQRHPDYQQAIETLIRLVKTWSGRVSQMSNEIDVRQEPARDLAEREFKTLLETWAQGQSIDPLLNDVQTVMKDARQDPELRDYYHTVMHYVNRLLREPGYASDASVKEGERLMERGKQVLRGNYEDHLRTLSNEVRRYMNLMAEDEIAREIRGRITQIHNDLWMDAEGNPAFKPHLLNDIKMTLLPAFMDEIRFIPLPRIEYSDKQFDVVVENLVISGDTLLPNVFDTKVESFNSFSFKSDLSKPSSQSIMIRLSEIQADIDDVVFSYHKKTGFPKIQDRGVASMSVGNKGITLVLRLHNSTDPAKTFKVDYCKCSVDKLKIKVSESRHNILYKTVAPLLMGTIRKQMAKSIENMVIEKLNALDARITQSIVETNQRLQDKRYESLPEEEKKHARPIKVAADQPRPSVWSSLVSIMNNAIKNRVNSHNEKKLEKKLEKRNSSSSHSASTQSPVSPRSSKFEPNVHVHSTDPIHHSDVLNSNTPDLTLSGKRFDSPPPSPKKAQPLTSSEIPSAHAH